MDGISYLLKGFSFLTKKGVRRYVIIPLLINLILFVLMIVWASHEFGTLLHWIDGQLPTWLQWLNGLLWLLFSIAAILFVSYSFALLAN